MRNRERLAEFANSRWLQGVFALVVLTQIAVIDPLATLPDDQTDPSEPVVPAAVAKPSVDYVFQNAVVAADHPLASAAGLEILKGGGNVVDAAVATAFALAVVRPASCGLGGGGFMVIWDARKARGVAIDYREQAPGQATADMYVDPSDPSRARDDLSRFGPLAVAVPGQVAGLCLALREYGTCDLPTVLAPALRLCREGFGVDPHDREVQAETIRELFDPHPEFRQRFGTLLRQYLNGGRPWGAEQRFRSPLGPVLERIARNGADGFYRGEVAEALVAEVRRGGGILTLDDLAAIRPRVREPLAATFGEYELFTMPPPSSGGVALLEVLNVIAAVEARHAERRLHELPADDPVRLHILAEAFQHAFADRAEFLGDADFAQVPMGRLTGADHAATLAERINLSRTQPAETYGRFAGRDDAGTSHFSIIDGEGNAVACTETINTGFGSLVVEPRFGVILNNEMDDFTAQPGRPNLFGLQQSAANAIAPGKRPLSSMTPTILVQDGRAAFALGASGGPRIITATAQVLFQLTRYGRSPEEAVRWPRLHHQWMPQRVELERGFPPATAEGLRRAGHTVRLIDESAVVQAVSRSKDGLRAASDPRKHGQPAGY